MIDSLFLSLDSAEIASEIRKAQHFACYVAPGIQPEPAKAMEDLARKIGSEYIKVFLDFDEHVMRMGFGHIESVESLRNAGIDVNSASGLRIGLVIVDDRGYAFTPTALYLEAEHSPDKKAPNAVRLSRNQIKDVLARLSPATKKFASASAKTEEERQQIEDQGIEIKSEKLAEAEFKDVEKKLKDIPPIDFDIARQTRVYTAYLQYVEIKLSGAAIQRHRFEIPREIQNFGDSEEFESRLKTTFDMIRRDDELSSKHIDKELSEIRKNFTRTLGKKHGRVMLKQSESLFKRKVDALDNKLKEHKEKMKKNLQERIDESRDQIINHYLPLVRKNPPVSLSGQVPEVTDDNAKSWLREQLERKLPESENLISKMKLSVCYKDVTFTTLNDSDFINTVKEVFPHVDWEKPYKEFKAAKERETNDDKNKF